MIWELPLSIDNGRRNLKIILLMSVLCGATTRMAAECGVNSVYGDIDGMINVIIWLGIHERQLGDENYNYGDSNSKHRCSRVQVATEGNLRASWDGQSDGKHGGAGRLVLDSWGEVFTRSLTYVDSQFNHYLSPTLIGSSARTCSLTPYSGNPKVRPRSETACSQKH